MIGGFGEVDISGLVLCQSGGSKEARTNGRPPVAGIAKQAVSRDGCDQASWIKLSYAGIPVIRHVEVTLFIQGQRGNGPEAKPGLEPGATVTTKARHARTRNSGDDAGGIHFAHRKCLHIRDEYVAGRIDSNSESPQR